MKELIPAINKSVGEDSNVFHAANWCNSNRVQRHRALQYI